VQSTFFLMVSQGLVLETFNYELHWLQATLA
jgi:hypothetical protein